MWKEGRSGNLGGSIQSTSHGETEPYTGRLLYRGAEADLLRGRWQGRDAVTKVRRPLVYRLRVLDDAIRRQRTVREAEMMHSARGAGVRSPHLYFVDPRGAAIVMEYIEGERMKDAVDGGSPKKVAGMFRRLGLAAARLHSAGIMHGDLTTANVILGGREITLLDFGLSSHTTRVEDHAVDLRLIKETIVGAHPGFSALALDALHEGYSSEAGPGRSKAVFTQLKGIERRGRYARVV
ncbi:MAG: Kae1-associated serine/threonine protein kinase [Thaumarchaeota archaeon]|nr:Kae1-associated serine/threonine protein kinase [Nitrososphaerota archaeon]